MISFYPNILFWIGILQMLKKAPKRRLGRGDEKSLSETVKSLGEDFEHVEKPDYGDELPPGYSPAHTNLPSTPSITTDQITAGLKAGAEVIDAGANLTREISDAVDKARKTLHEIAKENGALEVDLAENAKKVAEKARDQYNDLKHRRYWDIGRFAYPKLDLTRYGLTQGDLWKYENNKADELSQATLDRIQKANDDLEAFVRKTLQVNENYLTRGQQRKLDAANKQMKAADFELRKAIELAKKAGLDIEYEDLAAQETMTGFGKKEQTKPEFEGNPLEDSRTMVQAQIRRIYPNPDMFAALAFA